MAISRRPLTAWTTALLLCTLCTSFLAGCGGDDNDSVAPDRPTGSITVFAAASLTDAFTELGRQFEVRYPGTDVEFNFAASGTLVTQISNGAPADVYASADEDTMERLTTATKVNGAPVIFARNRMAIAVEPGNPKGIEMLADLANGNVIVVLCAIEVPCGRLADQVLGQAGVTVSARSREASVKATLTKVELGEADAAIVYATDIASSDQVDGVDIPADHNVRTALPIVTLADTDNGSVAAAWVAFVRSPEAAQMLTDDFGFLAP